MIKMTSLALLLVLGAAACSSDQIDSDEAARRAYLGLDESIAKSLTLGFAGFNAATSANIPDQNGVGILGGSLVITGQVDQGSSANKGMRLHVGMVGYTDGAVVIDGESQSINVTYDTSTDLSLQPFLNLSLKNIPTGTLEGTLMGVYQMTGDIVGETTLNVTFSGTLQDDGTGKVIRAPGTTTVTGTATSGSDGLYQIDVTL
jgi:hypothetical protein